MNKQIIVSLEVSRREWSRRQLLSFNLRGFTIFVRVSWCVLFWKFRRMSVKMVVSVWFVCFQCMLHPLYFHILHNKYMVEVFRLFCIDHETSIMSDYILFYFSLRTNKTAFNPQGTLGIESAKHRFTVLPRPTGRGVCMCIFFFYSPRGEFIYNL